MGLCFGVFGCLCCIVHGSVFVGICSGCVCFVMVVVVLFLCVLWGWLFCGGVAGVCVCVGYV